MQIPTNEDADYPVGEPLACPNCHEQYMHHYIAATFVGREDSVRLQCTTTSEAGTTFAEVDRAQHHARRDSVLIHFWCETCERNPVLRIVQHKGGTFIEWLPERFDRPRPPE